MLNLKLKDKSDLSQSRCRIDEIDQQIITLLTQRSACVNEIAGIKYQHKMPIYDSERETKIIEKISAYNPTGYHDVDMATIFHAILRAGLNQQLLYRSAHEE